MSVHYNRTEEAAKLLAEVEAWCARTSTAETVIGHALYRHPGLIGLLRKRLTVSEEKEAEIRTFLGQHPEGWRGQLPQTHAGGHPLPAGARRVPSPLPRKPANRDPCPRCGTRHDIGCQHAPCELRTML